MRLTCRSRWYNEQVNALKSLQCRTVVSCVAERHACWRMQVRGQLYVPEVNYIMMLLSIIVVAIFQNTVVLGNAYGTLRPTHPPTLGHPPRTPWLTTEPAAIFKQSSCTQVQNVSLLYAMPGAPLTCFPSLLRTWYLAIRVTRGPST